MYGKAAEAATAASCNSSSSATNSTVSVLHTVSVMCSVRMNERKESTKWQRNIENLI